MSRELYNRIGKNSLYNLLRRMFGFPIGLVLPLIVLSHIGVDGYGVWAFIQAFVAYVAILDLGSDALTKYTAEYESQNNRKKISQLFNTLFVVYAVLFIVSFIAVFIFRDRIINCFVKTDKLSGSDISFVLLSYTAVFGVNMILKLYSSFFNGLERMDLTNKVEMLAVVNNFIFSVIFLRLGWGIKGLAGAGAVSVLVTGFIYFVVCIKTAPYLRLNPFDFRFGVLKETRKFFLYGFLGGIAALIQFQCAKLIISYYLGVKYLAYYDLGQRLIFAIMGFCSSFSISIMPAASASYASLGMEKIKEIYQATTKYVALITVPIFFFMFVMADKIIYIWLGAGYEQSAFVLRFLSIAYLINLLTGPGASILTGIGVLEIPFYCSIANGLINIVLSFLLVSKFGLPGIVTSIITANILTSSFILQYFNRRISGSDVNIFSYLKFPVLTSMPILLTLAVAAQYIDNYYFKLFLSAGLFAAGYIFMVYKNPEYTWIKKFIRNPRSIFQLQAEA